MAPPLDNIRVFLSEIKFSHSVFALPFALASMLVAANGLPSFWTLFWILVACVAARTAAMAFNRLADRRFDAANPRTARRALVSGRLSHRFLALAMAGCALGFFFAAAMLNRLCLVLAPPTLAILLLYSLTKRFTDKSHYVLGLALGLAPLGAWIAVRESFAVAPILLGGAVLLWVAGFDILYSCQDYDFDRKTAELHSAPKSRGIAGAMAQARRCHAGALALFFLFWWWAGLGIPTLLGIVAVAGLLVRQHDIVSPRDLSRIDAAFFTANGLVSVAFFLAVALDVWMG